MRVQEWLDEKKPPPGGLVSLRQKINRSEGKHRFTRHRLLVPAGLVAILLVWFFALLQRNPTGQPELLQRPDLIVLGIQRPPAVSLLIENPLGNMGVGLVKILDNERVVYYQIIRPAGDPNL